LDGFLDVVGLDGVGGFEVGDGAGDFADFVEGAGGEAHFFHGLFHDELAGVVEGAVFFELGFAHGGVHHGASAPVAPAMAVGAAVGVEAFSLNGDGAGHLLAHLGGGGAFGFAGEVAVGDCRDLQVDVDAVEEGAGDAGHVAFHVGQFGGGGLAGIDGALAGVGGVHGGNEHKACGEGDGGVGAGDGDGAGLEGLAEDFEDATGEFGEFIEEEDAVVGEGDFTGAGDFAAADDGRSGGGVVGGADGAGADEGFAVWHEAAGGVDAGGFEGLLAGEGWEDGGEAFAEHGFAGAGGAEEEDIVAAGGGDSEGAFAELLAADFGEVVAMGGAGGVEGVFIELVGEEVEFAVEEADHFGDGADGDDVDAGDDGGFGGIVGGENEAGFLLLAGEHGHGEGTLDGAHAAIEGEFAGDEILFVVEGFAVGGDGARTFEDAVDEKESEGDGEFEGVAFLAEVGGGEVDDEATGGEAVAAVVEGGADAVDGFADGGVGEADDGGAGALLHVDFLGVIDFDFAGEGVDALKDGGVDFGEHDRTPSYVD
jgi:hypothetical protein